MRARLARLAALTAATALALGGLAAGAGAAQAAPGDNLTVTIVDTTGKATPGAAILFPVDDPSSPITLGYDSDLGITTVASTYSTAVPPGAYGLAVVTGWGGLTCLDVSPCSILALSTGLGGPVAPAITAGVTVPETGVKKVKMTSGVPRVVGSGVVGRALNVDFPAGYDDLTEVLRAYIEGLGGGLGGFSIDPTVTWQRNGTTIPGASGVSYVPTSADVGKKITAKVSYNLLLTTFLTSLSGGGSFPVPAAVTTSAKTVQKIATKVTLRVPAKVKLGKRPMALVTAKSGATGLSGWLTLKISRHPGVQRVFVRKGFAQTKLPALSVGKHTVTATFGATPAYVASHTSKKLVVTK